MPRKIPSASVFAVSAVFRMSDKSIALAIVDKRGVRYLRTDPVSDAALDRIVDAFARRTLRAIVPLYFPARIIDAPDATTLAVGREGGAASFMSDGEVERERRRSELMRFDFRVGRQTFAVRAFDVHGALRTADALRLCPEGFIWGRRSETEWIAWRPPVLATAV